jgi:peptidase M28-like protein
MASVDLPGAPPEREPLERADLEALLSEVVERLAGLDRTPCSPGEREAAEWLAQRLRGLADVDVALEHEPSWGTFPPTATGLGLTGVLGAALALLRRPLVGTLLAAASIAGIVDEAQNGPRVLRRAVRTRRGTVNVLARISGTREHGRRAAAAGAPGATPTLVVLAHHDAPQTGIVFDQTIQRRLHALAPELIEGIRTSPPQWWIGLAGPLCTIAGSLGGRPRLVRAGLLIGALGSALAADVWRSETVPGANDNLSGVAALVALGELLTRRPLHGLDVLLVSCGAEETLQDGVRAFLARHRHELPVGTTWFVNLDTIGSRHLIQLEAEGPVWMEEYEGPWLRDLLGAGAERLGVRVRRGYRARASTDSVIPSRAGYPIATLASVCDWGPPANYHLPSDIPANLEYASVADATLLVSSLARELARGLAVGASPRGAQG